MAFNHGNRTPDMQKLDCFQPRRSRSSRRMTPSTRQTGSRWPLRRGLNFSGDMADGCYAIEGLMQSSVNNFMASG
jgi:hypothetical protein